MSSAPMVVHFIIASVGAASTFHQGGRRLKILPYYLAFIASAALLGLAMVHANAQPYRVAFWTVEFCANLLLALACFEIVATVMPRRFAEPAGIFILGILALSIARSWPNGSTAALLNASVSIMACSGVLLALLAFVDGEWPEGMPVCAIGLAAVLAGSLLPEAQWITGNLSAWMLQLGDLPGLCILAACQKKGQSVGVKLLYTESARCSVETWQRHKQ